MTLYPTPKLLPWLYGPDRAKRSVEALRNINLKAGRYICVSMDNGKTPPEFFQYVRECLSPEASYEAWLQRRHGVPNEHLYGRPYHNIEQPSQLLASREKWVRDLIEFLEKQA